MRTVFSPTVVCTTQGGNGIAPHFFSYRKALNMSDKPAAAKLSSRNESREFILVLVLSVLLLATLL